MSSAIYEGAAEVGKVQSYIGLIIACIVTIIMIGVSIYLFTVDQHTLVDDVGTVLSADCSNQVNLSDQKDKQKEIQNCNLLVKYKVNGEEYRGNLLASGNKIYNNGNVIDITYDSTNPTEITTHQIRSKTIAIILLVLGLLIGGGSYMNYYFTSKYKSYAAIQGTAATLDVISSPFRRT
jgi:hypothetical protein